MKTLCLSLRENDRRRYAAVEAAKLGHGGTEYISQLLGCDPNTILQGQADLQKLEELAPEDLGPSERVRTKGWPSADPWCRAEAIARGTLSS